MNRWKWLIGMLVVLLMAATAQVQSPEKLPEILKKAAVYCESVKSVALHFYCRQTMDECNYSYRVVAVRRDETPVKTIVLNKTKKRQHTYDYQMVRDDAQLFEHRLPFGSAAVTASNIAVGDSSGTMGNSNAAIPSLPSASGKVGPSGAFSSMHTQYIVYGPVSFLSRYWQFRFQYTITGEEMLAGRTALVIRADPKQEGKENNFRARIWIDPADASVLKIIYEPLSLDAYPDLPKPPLPELKPRLQVQLEYGLEKNGIRFPSRESIRYDFIGPDEKEFERYSADIAYTDYRYFIVNTVVEVKK